MDVPADGLHESRIEGSPAASHLISSSVFLFFTLLRQSQEGKKRCTSLIGGAECVEEGITIYIKEPFLQPPYWVTAKNTALGASLQKYDGAYTVSVDCREGVDGVNATCETREDEEVEEE